MVRLSNMKGIADSSRSGDLAPPFALQSSSLFGQCLFDVRTLTRVLLTFIRISLAPGDSVNGIGVGIGGQLPDEVWQPIASLAIKACDSTPTTFVGTPATFVGYASRNCKSKAVIPVKH